MGGDFHASWRILIALQKERLLRLHCSFMTHFMLTRPQSSLLRKERSARGETTGDESAFYDTFYNAIRVLSFHCCWLDQKFIIQRTHSCFTTFLLKSVFSSNVFCSWMMGFRGVINVILRKKIGMSGNFSIFHPLPPPTPTQQLEDVHPLFVF